MKVSLKLSLVCAALLAAACSPAAEEAPAAPETAPAAAAEAPAPEPVPSDAQAGLTGRWGVTDAACSPDNAMKDGLIEIAVTTASLGVDTCEITQAEPEGAGVHLTALCESGEGGEPYDSVLYLLNPTPDTLQWTKEDGATENYVRCG